MLRIGLTGGIGAGKSAVTSVFERCGGVVVDADVIAREVVEPGTEGLAALVEAFGDDILSADGALDRPALAAKAFGDDDARSTLNGIVHPLVGKRREEIIASVPADSVVVEDIPLLVESGMAPLFPLVVVVQADEQMRLRRLVDQRGMPESDARARIAAQAGDDQRRAVADVWLDNSGSLEALSEIATGVWNHRISPFARNLTARQVARPAARLVPADPTWPDQAQRIMARIGLACGQKARRVDHIGSTAVSGLDAKDAIDIQVTVDSLAVADELADSLLSAGYPRIPEITGDVAKFQPRSTVNVYDRNAANDLWYKRIHASADPGRPTFVHLRVDGWPGQQFALLFVDWLRADPDARAEYLAVKQQAATAVPAEDGSLASAASEVLADAKEPWYAGAYRRAWEWADATGWRP
jgi:dephospho-CoA kinase